MLCAAADALDGVGPPLAALHERARAVTPLLCRIIDLDARSMPKEAWTQQEGGESADEAPPRPRPLRREWPQQHSDRAYDSRARTATVRPQLL